MTELLDSHFVSELHTRLYVWIRCTGETHIDGWSSCRATNRALGFLDSLSIEYTIIKSKTWFTFLNTLNKSIDFWQIQGYPFIEEFYYIKNLAKIPYKLDIDIDEQIPFMMMLEGIGYEYKGSLNRILKIEKKVCA